jgi:nitroreductase
MTTLDFLTLAKTRKQTYEFSEKEVKDKHLKMILEAARWAPNCGNVQPWHFVVVRNKNKIKELVEGTYHVHFPFISNYPPLIVAFILDKKCLEENQICSETPQQKITDAYLCIAMAVLNSILSAQDLGINSCILTPKREKSAKLLKVKKEHIVVLLVGFGHERTDAFKKIRTRKELKELVSYEHYGGRNKNKK